MSAAVHYTDSGHNGPFVVCIFWRPTLWVLLQSICDESCLYTRTHDCLGRGFAFAFWRSMVVLLSSLTTEQEISLHPSFFCSLAGPVPCHGNLCLSGLATYSRRNLFGLCKSADTRNTALHGSELKQPTFVTLIAWIACYMCFL